MAKYRLKFKANDKKETDPMRRNEADIQKIYRFYKDHIGHEPKFSFRGGEEDDERFRMNVRWKSERGDVKVVFQFEPERTVRRMIENELPTSELYTYEKFSTLELKFFDAIDFELHKRYKELGQDIYDWFDDKELDGKAIDMLTNALAKANDEPILSTTEMMTRLGYENYAGNNSRYTSWFKHIDGGTKRVYVYVEEKTKEVDKWVGEADAAPDRCEEYQMFTKKELQLLDTNGYSLEYMFQTETKQEITDWF